MKISRFRQTIKVEGLSICIMNHFNLFSLEVFMTTVVALLSPCGFKKYANPKCYPNVNLKIK